MVEKWWSHCHRRQKQHKHSQTVIIFFLPWLVHSSNGDMFSTFEVNRQSSNRHRFSTCFLTFQRSNTTPPSADFLTSLPRAQTRWLCVPSGVGDPRPSRPVWDAAQNKSKTDWQKQCYAKYCATTVRIPFILYLLHGSSVPTDVTGIELDFYSKAISLVKKWLNKHGQCDRKSISVIFDSTTSKVTKESQSEQLPIFFFKNILRLSQM